MKIIEKHPTKSAVVIYCFVWIAVVLFIAIFFSSCTTQEKYNSKALKHKDWLSQLCSSTFPIDTTLIQENTDTTKADNIDYSKTIDSLRSIAENALNQAKGDMIYTEKECNELLQWNTGVILSLSRALNKLRDEYKPCKPSFITKTITITKESTARLYEANLEIEKLEGEVSKKESQRNWLFGFLLIAVAIIFIVKR